MQTTSTKIVVLSPGVPMAEVPSRSGEAHFVVTRSAAGEFFVIKPREAELLSAELPGETLAGALAKAGWTPSRTHQQILPPTIRGPMVIVPIAKLTLRNEEERVVVVDHEETPRSVIYFARDKTSEYQKWLIENCPAYKPQLGALFPSAFIGEEAHVVVVENKAGADQLTARLSVGPIDLPRWDEPDEITTALTAALAVWNLNRDATSLRRELLKVLEALADRM